MWSKIKIFEFVLNPLIKILIFTSLIQKLVSFFFQIWSGRGVDGHVTTRHDPGYP